MDKVKMLGIYEEGYGVVAKKVMRDKTLNILSKAVYAYICSYTGKGKDAFPSQ
ncbi:helix-turn-helix domain-containing protein, partial [Fusobacterium ulcerans]